MTNSVNFLTPPPLNEVSKGAAAFESACISRKYSVYDLIGTGTPVDGVVGTGTGAGFAGPGSRYTDVAAGKMYLNGGTKASPAWKIITSA